MNRLVITNTQINSRDITLELLLDEQRKPLELYAQSENTRSLVGNIYIARVLQVVKNINGAFLEIAPGQSVYYSLEDFSNVIFTKNQNGKEELCQGDEVVVQVKKDAIKTKDPIVTTNISIPGEHVMLTSGKHEVGISRKITGTDRTRMKELLQELTLPCGVIIRTNGKSCSNEQLKQEIISLVQEYELFLSQVIHKSCYSLISQAPASYMKRLQELKPEEIEAVVTDDSSIYDEMLHICQNDSSFLKWKDKITLYQDDYSLEKLYGIPTIVKRACDKLVWLPSGGNLVIEQTEAMTVIDVNSSKSVKKGKTSQMFYELNLEAGLEVLRQLRLRNLSGIIMVDFINMPDSRQEEMLLLEMRKAAKDDPIKVTMVDITKLGLMEITREKKYPSLWEQIEKNH